MKKNRKWLGRATKVVAGGTEPMAGGSRRGLTFHDEGVNRKCDGGAHVTNLARYVVSNRIWYHLVWCPLCGKMAQCCSPDRAARSMKGGAVDGGWASANKAGAVNIQVCVAGFGPGRKFTDTKMKNIERIGKWADSWGVPHKVRSKWGPGSGRGRSTWMKGGVQGHCHGPHDDHTDPGPIDPKKLKAALWPNKRRRNR